jgi:cytochrome c oxidase subunit 2
VENFRWMLLVFCLLVFLVVFLVMFVSMWKHHRDGIAKTSNFHPSVAVEMSWALAPCFIVVLMVWPTARTVLGW